MNEEMALKHLEKALSIGIEEGYVRSFNAFSNKEIAAELCITIRTAAAHTANIYKKLGVKSRAQCIKKAWPAGE